MKRSPLKRKTNLSPSPAPKRTKPLSASPRKGRRGFTPASKEQREKVRDQGCLVCGDPNVDPAHVTPRAWGGCDDAECVVALCRAHHREFDQGGLSILGELVSRKDHVVLAHALRHYNCDLIALLHRVTGERYVPAGDPLERAA